MARPKKKTSNSEMHIPFELVFMILIRLPTKFLLQMKSVCSTWRDMISNPGFIKSHLHRSNDGYALHPIRYIRSLHIRYDHTTPMTRFSRYVEILGSCNGLLLLGDNDHSYYLWNPSTRVLRSFNGPPIFRGQFRNFALGYDSTTRAYKVVRIVRVSTHRFGSEPAPYDVTRAHIYNCKTGCWKNIKKENFPYVIFEDARGVTVNGVPHWVMFRPFRDYNDQNEIRNLVIVYFDLADEKFKEITKPDWLVDSSVYEFGVYDGKLCFINYTRRDEEIWVMGKDGGECWINVSSGVDIENVRVPGWNSGYRVNNNIFGEKRCVCAKNVRAFVGAQCVETLVSPRGGSDMVG